MFTDCTTAIAFPWRTSTGHQMMDLDPCRVKVGSRDSTSRWYCDFWPITLFHGYFFFISKFYCFTKKQYQKQSAKVKFGYVLFCCSLFRLFRHKGPAVWVCGGLQRPSNVPKFTRFSGKRTTNTCWMVDFIWFLYDFIWFYDVFSWFVNLWFQWPFMLIWCWFQWLIFISKYVTVILCWYYVDFMVSQLSKSLGWFNEIFCLGMVIWVAVWSVFVVLEIKKKRRTVIVTKTIGSEIVQLILMSHYHCPSLILCLFFVHVIHTSWISWLWHHKWLYVSIPAISQGAHSTPERSRQALAHSVFLGGQLLCRQCTCLINCIQLYRISYIVLEKKHVRCI